MDPRNQQEFVSLLTDHQEVIRSYIISQLPGSPDVRDILQEVNIMLWEKAEEFEIGTNFGAWSCTVAYYKILEHRRKLKMDGKLAFADDLGALLSDESIGRETDDLEEKRTALILCLRKLSSKNRDLLRARYESQKGGMERVAEETGRTKESLRVTLSRLRSVLRRCINGMIDAKGGVA
ncbi:MAG: sigma-70 family RNA polymerase sigma factor [Akkermansiaceae bacterium]|nr:sigma-70 family RNA polymerase sigma factor [Akkermansiaceae bacterium]MDP4720881.1 sigma-70 family RNA polymerase sigma factor [Akkermansiaceae bacterium]MDP4780760.1 sigma-70 family RNA polymerase sigma factor [Akkermansiaceae bacterium]MDP4845706.1 sigma-70 family RNA polymerase sigma factor [Akkermansiaceae bacterium]MDP4898169.1 sigma-70 family RNA polymerase sigma factor [Akkermansiaceae bacterium]